MVLLVTSRVCNKKRLVISSQVLILDYWNNVMHFKANWGSEQGLYGVSRASYNIQVKETH